MQQIEDLQEKLKDLDETQNNVCFIPRHRLHASCGFYQLHASLSPSYISPGSLSSCMKSVKIRTDLLQVVVTTCIEFVGKTF